VTPRQATEAEIRSCAAEMVGALGIVSEGALPFDALSNAQPVPRTGGRAAQPLTAHRPASIGELRGHRSGSRRSSVVRPEALQQTNCA